MTTSKTIHDQDTETYAGTKNMKTMTTEEEEEEAEE